MEYAKPSYRLQLLQADAGGVVLGYAYALPSLDAHCYSPRLPRGLGLTISRNKVPTGSFAQYIPSRPDLARDEHQKVRKLYQHGQF